MACAHACVCVRCRSFSCYELLRSLILRLKWYYLLWRVWLVGGLLLFPSVCVGGRGLLYIIVTINNLVSRTQNFDNYKLDDWSLWLLTTPMKQQNLLQNHHKKVLVLLYVNYNIEIIYLCEKKLPDIWPIQLIFAIQFTRLFQGALISWQRICSCDVIEIMWLLKLSHIICQSFFVSSLYLMRE